MPRTSVFDMRLSKVYPALVAKAERKGRTADEVDQATCWLLGYTPGQVHDLLATDVTYGDFFRQAPHVNEAADQVGGTICHVRLDDIDDPVLQNMRRLDTLVDESAHGRPMEKVLRA